MKKDSKQNNFNGKVNFHGPAQIAGGDIINFLNEEKSRQQLLDIHLSQYGEVRLHWRCYLG